MPDSLAEIDKHFAPDEFKRSNCDMCRKENLIIPTGIGKYLGEDNPKICNDCKDILEVLSEPTLKLVIWEINKLRSKDKR